MLGKFFKVLTNNVAVTGANGGLVTIPHLLELIGPLPKGTTKERLAAQDARIAMTIPRPAFRPDESPIAQSRWPRSAIW
jgi:hypothetical protein